MPAQNVNGEGVQVDGGAASEMKTEGPLQKNETRSIFDRPKQAPRPREYLHAPLVGEGNHPGRGRCSPEPASQGHQSQPSAW